LFGKELEEKVEEDEETDNWDILLLRNFQSEPGIFPLYSNI